MKSVHWEQIFRSAGRGAVLIDLDGATILAANQTFARMHGYSRDEVVGMRLAETLAPEFRTMVSETARRVRDHGHRTFETVSLRKDGSTLPTLFDLNVVEEEGRPQYLAANIQDITAHKHAEDTLRLYRRAVESSTDAVAALDRNHAYLFANRAYLDRHKLGGEEIRGRRFAEVVGERYYRDELKPLLDRCLDGETLRFVTKFSYPEAGDRYLDAVYLPLTADGGEVEGVLGIARDITDQKRTEDRLRIGEERYRNYIEQTSDGVWRVELDAPCPVDLPENEQIRLIMKNRIAECNSAMARMYGFDDAESMVGQSLSDFITEEGAEQTIRMFIRGGYRITGFETEETDRHGERRHFVNNCFGIIHDGSLMRFWGTQQDITERVLATEESAQLREQNYQAQKVESIGRLAGGVSHDLNNLLSPIIGFCELLLQDLEPGDERRDSVEEILRAGLRSRDLVGQLLAFGRKQNLAYEPVDLNATVHGLEALVRRTIREDIDLTIVTAPDARPVMADVGQMEQVILNLVINAADAMPEGGRLTIGTAAVHLDDVYAAQHTDVEPGAYTMLAVSDTGCGIDEESREHMFEPFYSTKDAAGTGLGLATVFGIVKQHGGNIWVYGEPGAGTTIKVYLPVTEEIVTEDVVVATAAADLTGTETILVVEDNEQVRYMACTALARQGYRVLAAEGGPEAIRILSEQEDPVHLVLTDVVMPKMNGKELYGKLSATVPGLKVLYMSGYTDNVVAHNGTLDKDVAFIQKPFCVQDLALKVREVLG